KAAGAWDGRGAPREFLNIGGRGGNRAASWARPELIRPHLPIACHIRQQAQRCGAAVGSDHRRTRPRRERPHRDELSPSQSARTPDNRRTTDNTAALPHDNHSRPRLPSIGRPDRAPPAPAHHDRPALLATLVREAWGHPLPYCCADLQQTWRDRCPIPPAPVSAPQGLRRPRSLSSSAMPWYIPLHALTAPHPRST